MDRHVSGIEYLFAVERKRGAPDVENPRSQPLTEHQQRCGTGQQDRGSVQLARARYLPFFTGTLEAAWGRLFGPFLTGVFFGHGGA